jgi:hypothetical protein
MKIKPTENWKLLSTGIELSTTKVYDAEPAMNQPNYEKNESIFAEGVLLHKGEYEVINNEFKYALVTVSEDGENVEQIFTSKYDDLDMKPYSNECPLVVGSNQAIRSLDD